MVIGGSRVKLKLERGEWLVNCTKRRRFGLIADCPEKQRSEPRFSGETRARGVANSWVQWCFPARGVAAATPRPHVASPLYIFALLSNREQNGTRVCCFFPLSFRLIVHPPFHRFNLALTISFHFSRFRCFLSTASIFLQLAIRLRQTPESVLLFSASSFFSLLLAFPNWPNLESSSFPRTRNLKSTTQNSIIVAPGLPHSSYLDGSFSPFDSISGEFFVDPFPIWFFWASSVVVLSFVSFGMDARRCSQIAQRIYNVVGVVSVLPFGLWVMMVNLVLFSVPRDRVFRICDFSLKPAKTPVFVVGAFQIPQFSFEGNKVQGRRGRGGPRKTLEETLRKDLRVLGFNGGHDTKPSAMTF
ncbi:hypothetical protein DVH24_000109 [Malus domestica]|uniref:Uncharacterized protein n=1 Tax=Malus domestica TaxID=3750 RepID=A0A498IZ15_MALDO|nr:hypothetical protein DVH24_000109 [Malus domestica]